jgi:hypothetical protein
MRIDIFFCDYIFKMLFQIFLVRMGFELGASHLHFAVVTLGIGS